MRSRKVCCVDSRRDGIVSRRFPPLHAKINENNNKTLKARTIKISVSGHAICIRVLIGLQVRATLVINFSEKLRLPDSRLHSRVSSGCIFIGYRIIYSLLLTVVVVSRKYSVPQKKKLTRGCGGFEFVRET